jgi:hypothetical protein
MKQNLLFSAGLTFESNRNNFLSDAFLTFTEDNWRLRYAKLIDTRKIPSAEIIKNN